MTESNAKYKTLFFTEAEEKIAALNTALLGLEKAPSDTTLASDAMRASHTLKSSAAAMGYLQISHLVHVMEDMFEGVSTKKTNLKPQTIGILFTCADVFSDSVNALRSGKEEINTEDLIETLEKGDTDDKTIHSSPQDLMPLSAIKVDIRTLDVLMNLSEELLVERMRLNQMVKTVKEKPDETFTIAELEARSQALDRLISELQVNVTQARMVPLGQIFERFPRVVRDLAHDQNKEVDFSMAGQEIELDRTVIDRLGEPLIHLLRNAVDHGIETSGKIKLTAARERDKVIIKVTNEGRPIDWQRLIEVAGDKGIIDEKTRDKYTGDINKWQAEIENLMYQLSTKDKVTELSGRGVGLGIVKSTIEALGGNVTIAAKENGTGFILTLPLTLAIIQALLVRVTDQIYALPFSQIDHSERVAFGSIKKAFDQEIAVIGSEDIPVIRLDKFFNIQRKGRGIFLSDEEISARGNIQKTELMVITKGRSAAAIVVDEMISEQNIVVKPLKGMLRQTKGIAGITLLGDGKPAMILDVTTLLQL